MPTTETAASKLRSGDHAWAAQANYDSTSKLNRSKPNGVSLLQCAEDVADLPVDLGQLLVDRRQIHVLLPLRVRATETPRGKAKSERKEG